MGLRRFVLDLPQVSNWLNQEKLESEKVSIDELKMWADAGCFPFEKKGESYRISENTLPLVEEVKHLIKTEEFSIEEAKNMLQHAVAEKERYLESLERRELPTPELLLVLASQQEAVLHTIQETANGLILSLIDTETSLKEHQEEVVRESEEKIKGAIFHAESRMKTVLERVEKRIMEQVAQLATETPKDEFDALIKQHQKELLGLTEQHEKEIGVLKEAFQGQLKEKEIVYKEAYEELLHAGFFKRMKLKKEWKEQK